MAYILRIPPASSLWTLYAVAWLVAVAVGTACSVVPVAQGPVRAPEKVATLLGHLDEE
jgi:hypothetical protein